MNGVQGQRANRMLIRLPEKLLSCFCRKCGTYCGHIRYDNGYLDMKCKKCSSLEIFVSDEVGNLAVITESFSA